MVFAVIENDLPFQPARASGFRNSEFRRLAGLYSRACSAKIVSDMAVDVDMDEGICLFSYFRTAHSPAALTFIVRHAGPRTNLYELWAEGRGRIEKSGLFARVFERLEHEMQTLAAASWN